MVSMLGDIEGGTECVYAQAIGAESDRPHSICTTAFLLSYVEHTNYHKHTPVLISSMGYLKRTECQPSTWFRRSMYLYERIRYRPQRAATRVCAQLDTIIMIAGPVTFWWITSMSSIDNRIYHTACVTNDPSSPTSIQERGVLSMY